MHKLRFSQMPGDFWIGLGAIVAAGVGIALIRTNVGPLLSDRSILPLIGACGCLLLGVGLAVQSWVNTGQSGNVVEPRNSSGMVRFGLAVGAVALHAAVLKQLGLVIAGISLQIMLFYLVGVRSIWRILVLSCGCAGVLYFGISVLLGVPLPQSTLW